MDDRFKKAASTVMDFVEGDGCSKDVIAYHDRGIRQLAGFLELTGSRCIPQAIDRWLDQGRAVWCNCKFKQNRLAAQRLLEAMEHGRVSPSAHSHAGPTDYSRLSGWSKRSVDRYAQSAADTFSEEEGKVARTYASQFLARSGLSDAVPADITADAIVAYVRECGGAKSVRATRLSHLRGFLSSLAEAGEAEPWAVLLASDRFACKFDSCCRVEGLGSAGMPPNGLPSLIDGFVAALAGAGYAGTQQKAAAKALQMLYIALSLAGAAYTPENAEIWLSAASSALGTQVASYARILRLFSGYVASGELDTAVMKRKPDELAGSPAWARGEIASYIELRRREGCSPSTLGCTARACVRLAAYAEACGACSWSDVDAGIVSAWCAEDPHETAEGRACYVGKARGFLECLEDEGLARPGTSLAARSEAAPTRKVVAVLDDSDIAAAEEARLSASTPMELRDAAIVALGLTMGLRSCDVAGLRLSDISWRSSTVSIIQRKTGVQLDAPLTVAAGNAIAAYLRDGRPDSPSPFVFVKHRAPYDGVDKGVCGDAMARTFGPHVGGFHALRRTFATAMLRGGAGRRGVAEALGHATDRSTGPYLSLDAERMRTCALSLSECGIGGFHD